jgi:hypothetical protein
VRLGCVVRVESIGQGGRLCISPYGEQLEYQKTHTLAPFMLLKSIFYPLFHLSINQDYIEHLLSTAKLNLLLCRTSHR